MLKFAIQNRALADCNPTLVLAASEQPHAALLKDINRILLHVNSQERDSKTNWNTAKTKILSKVKVAKAFLRSPYSVPSAVASPEVNHHNNVSQPANASSTWLEKIQNCWKRSNRVVPIDPNNEQRYDDAPKLFVDSFALKREFVESYMTESAALSLLTMMIFNEADDFGSSRDCKRCRQKFDANLVAFQKTFRALFCLSKELEFADSSDKILLLSLKERMFQISFDMIFGKELKVLRNFNRLSDKEIAELFLMHDFPELDVDDFFGPSVDAVLKQMLAADAEKLVHPSTHGIQAQNLDDESYPNTLNLVPSIDESSQAQHAFPARKHDEHPQSSAAVSPPRFSPMRPGVISSKEFLFAARSTKQAFSGASGSDEDHSSTIADLGVAVSASTVMPRLRPTMYSSKDSLAAASAASPASGSDENQFSRIATASDELRSAQVQSTAAIYRATAAEAELRTLMNRNAALSDELRLANVGTAAALERAAALDAQVKDSAADVARLTKQVNDLQAALDAAAQAHKSPQTQSKKGVLTSAELRDVQIKSEVQTPTAQVQDLQAARLAALQSAAAAELQVQTLSDELRLANAGAAAALERAAASDAQVKHSAGDVARLTKQVNDLQAAALERAAASDAEVNDLLAARLAALHQAAAAEMNVQSLTAQVKDLHAELVYANKAADPSDFAVEKQDLQAARLAALQRAAAAELELQTLSDELKLANAGAAAALERAAASDAQVKDSAADVARLTKQVNDLQAKLLSANHAADPSNSLLEVHAKAVDPNVEHVKKLVDDSIQQQVRRALSRQSATGGAAIAAPTRPKTAHVIRAPSPALSHLGNGAFFRHNFAAPSKNPSSEALPPFTKARQPQCGCSC
jgi:hypothetical protein